MRFALHHFRLTCGALLAAACAGTVAAADIPAPAMQRLQAGDAVDLIVEYEAAAVEAQLAAQRKQAPRRFDDPAILGLRAERYASIRKQVDAAADPAGVAGLKDYKQLPMAFRRFRSAEAARAYAASAGVKALYENEAFHAVLAQSLPLVGQGAVAAAGETGGGTTVAVIDNGIDYTRAEFGACTAPGVPAGCRVAVSLDFGTGTTDKNHGTNVSAIVAGIAPGSRIAMLNAFSGTLAYTADILEALDWAIANQGAYNIVAINMSLGNATRYTAPCAVSNVYATPVANARGAGITVVASSGNEAFTDGIVKPACTPGVVSVGAVYDANVGGLSWGSGLCTDSTTAADKVACFSNSASFLTLLAPGALIAAAGLSYGGTSQASPHVAGAVAVLRATFPGETLEQTQARLTGKGKAVTDPRNGIVTPRLNLLEAARPANDAFAVATLLSGSSGGGAGVNLLATRESGEPEHAGNPGGRSVWWRWTAPASGQVGLNTRGSAFDTLLGVYVGGAVGALQAVAANDNDSGTTDGTSSLLFQAQGGTQYWIALDGADAESGAFVLDWSLNTAAQSNLSLTLAVSSSGPDASSHVVTVSNAGPQVATGVSVTVNLPAGATYAGGAAECVAAGAVVTCNVGILASGASANLSFQLSWIAGGGTGSLSASVASDLPDPVAADNSQVVLVTLDAGTDGDVPTLPEWGTLLLALLLAGMAMVGRPRGMAR